MKVWNGHKIIGRLTVFGDNAMHWGCTFWTKRWGYLCFRLPFRSCGRWWPLYFYASPNATPWAATFVLGHGHDDDWAKARVRKYYLGHNFDCDSEYDENGNYKTLMRINRV